MVAFLGSWSGLPPSSPELGHALHGRLLEHHVLEVARPFNA